MLTGGRPVSVLRGMVVHAHVDERAQIEVTRIKVFPALRPGQIEQQTRTIVPCAWRLGVWNDRDYFVNYRYFSEHDRPLMAAPGPAYALRTGVATVTRCPTAARQSTTTAKGADLRVRNL